MENDPSPWQSIHALWTSALTAAGISLGWIARRAVKDVDDKIAKLETNKVNKDVFEIHAKSVEDKLGDISEDVRGIRDTVSAFSTRRRPRK